MTNENTTLCTGWCTPKDEKRNVQSTVLTTFLFSFFDKDVDFSNKLLVGEHFFLYFERKGLRISNLAFPSNACFGIQDTRIPPKKQVTENLRWSVEASFKEYQIFYHKLVHVKKSIHTNHPS